MSDLVIGIDLGTTNSCVCVYLNKKLKILENKEGGRITPSYVYFTDQCVTIVGKYAKRMSDARPEYGIYEIKRLIGRKCDDPYVKKNLNYLPFQVKDIGNEPLIVVQTKNQLIKKRPQDLCTCILEKIKKDVQDKLGQPVTKAVITVPAYFNIAQREATLAAATQAGFTVLKLLNEPTAAALSYYQERPSDTEEQTFSLVYDLGGGTFDVAVLRRQGADIHIVGVDGETHLGGHDLDNLLVEHACQELIRKYGYNVKSDRRNMRRLNNECEEAKKILSNVEETSIMLNAFLPEPNNSIEIPITRQMFEEMAAPLFDQTIQIVDRCLKKLNLTVNDIEEIILAGGSTRIPKVQALLSKYFNQKPLNMFVNPDECVAEGAAIQAAMLSDSPEQAIDLIKITDVTALSLGISNFVGVMTFLISRNTPIPVSNSTKRITVYNNQANMTFDIYEGERLEAKKNHFLGVLEITDLTPAPPGKCTVSVTMSIDMNGILTVSATETVSNKTKDLKIAYTRGARNDSEVKDAVVDARESKEEDERFNRFATVKGFLIKFCVRAMYNFEQKKLTVSQREAYEKCADVAQRVKTFGVNDEEEVQRLKTEIVALCKPVAQTYNFIDMP